MSLKNFSTFENLVTLFTDLGRKLAKKPTVIRLSQAEYDQARAEILGDVIGDDISPEDKKKKEEVL